MNASKKGNLVFALFVLTIVAAVWFCGQQSFPTVHAVGSHASVLQEDASDCLVRVHHSHSTVAPLAKRTDCEGRKPKANTARYAEEPITNKANVVVPPTPEPPVVDEPVTEPVVVVPPTPPTQEPPVVIVPTPTPTCEGGNPGNLKCKGNAGEDPNGKGTMDNDNTGGNGNGEHGNQGEGGNGKGKNKDN